MTSWLGVCILVLLVFNDCFDASVLRRLSDADSLSNLFSSTGGLKIEDIRRMWFGSPGAHLYEVEYK